MRFLSGILSRYGALLIQFGIVALVAQRLTGSDAGAYLFIFGVVTTTSTIAGTGMPDGLIRMSASAEARNRVAVRAMATSVLRRSAGSVVIGGVAITLTLVALGRTTDVALLAGVWWMSYATTFVAAQTVVATGSPALGTFLFYSAINVGLLLTLVPYLVLRRDPLLVDVVGVTAAGSAAAALVAFILAVRAVHRHSGAQPGVSPRLLARVGAPIAAGRFAQAAIVWVPVWVATELLGDAQGALLALASRLTMAVGAMLAAVRFSVRPELARLAAEGRWAEISRRGSSVAFWATSLALVAVIGALLAGGPLIGAIFGESYSAAGVVVAIMLLGSLGESLGGPVDEALKMSGDAPFVLRTQLVCLVVGVFACWWCALLGQLEWVAGAYSAAFAAMYIAMILRVRARRGVWLLPRLTGRRGVQRAGRQAVTA